MFRESLEFARDDVVGFPAYDQITCPVFSGVCMLLYFHEFLASMLIDFASCIGSQNYFMLCMFDSKISRLCDIAGERM